MSVVETRHGPVINELTPLAEGLVALALRWVGSEPSRLPRALLAMNRAHNWSEFTAALADWTAPAQNFVYADRAGNIGYHYAGQVPIRARLDR
jgi:penicillin amidase